MLVSRRSSTGFTIVELLIVIVVIAILAAVTIVAYNGIQNRANDTAVQSDLRNFASIMGQQKAINGAYPDDLDVSMGIKFTKSAYKPEGDAQNRTMRYCRNTLTDQYVILAVSKSGNYFKYRSADGLSSNDPTYGWGVCALVGLTETNPKSQNNGYDTTRTPVWASWVN